jgi:uncharacterized protein YkwD
MPYQLQESVGRGRRATPRRHAARRALAGLGAIALAVGFGSTQIPAALGNPGGIEPERGSLAAGLPSVGSRTHLLTVAAIAADGAGAGSVAAASGADTVIPLPLTTPPAVPSAATPSTAASPRQDPTATAIAPATARAAATTVVAAQAPATPMALQPTPTPTAPPTPLPATTPSGRAGELYVPAVRQGGPNTLEARLFDGMNAERAAAGMPPLQWDATLAQIGRIRVQQMVDLGYFGHRDSAGVTQYPELLKHFGIWYSWAGENLALNNYSANESAERALASLMASSSHRANILDGTFTHAGVGQVTTANGRHYYAIIYLSY